MAVGIQNPQSYMMISTQIGPPLHYWDIILLYLIIPDITGGNKLKKSSQYGG